MEINSCYTKPNSDAENKAAHDRDEKVKNLNRHDAHLLVANGRAKWRTKRLVYRSSEIPWKVIHVVGALCSRLWRFPDGERLDDHLKVFIDDSPRKAAPRLFEIDLNFFIKVVSPTISFNLPCITKENAFLCPVDPTGAWQRCRQVIKRNKTSNTMSLLWISSPSTSRGS